MAVPRNIFFTNQDVSRALMLPGLTVRVLLLATLVNGLDSGSGVCDGLSVHNKSSNLVRGSHLVICEVHYPPFAISPSRRDEGYEIPAGAPEKDGWVGMDMVMFEEFAGQLGFTYEVQLREKIAADTNWTSTLFRISGTGCDIVGGFWTHTPLRREGLLFMSGHVDYSSVLIVRANTEDDAPLEQKLWTFLMPFDGYAWLALLAMTIVTGFVMFALESTADATIARAKDALYQSAASTLWGGFAEPKTAVAVPYQVVNGFIVLILVSACKLASKSDRPIAAPIASVLQLIPGFAPPLL